MSADIRIAPIYSAAMAQTIEVVVTLPNPCWTDRNKRYPVIYFLDGYTGNGLRLFDRNDPECFLADVEQQCTEYGIIMVAAGCVDKWYLDSPVDAASRWQTFLVKELIPHVDRVFPTLHRKESRAITGLSMGGHGAFYTALRNPELFTAVGSTSGVLNIAAVQVEESYLVGTLGPRGGCDRNIYSAFSYLDGIEKGGLDVYFDCGTEDLLLPINQDMHERLQKAGIPHVYREFPGGHTHDYWCRRFPEHVNHFNCLLRR